MNIQKDYAVTAAAIEEKIENNYNFLIQIQKFFLLPISLLFLRLKFAHRN